MTGREIQLRLHQLADELKFPVMFPRPLAEIAEEIHHLTGQISRRKAVRRAAPTALPMTPERKLAIAKFAAAHPDQPHRVIGRRFGVDGGRVSEIVAGKRT